MPNAVSARKPGCYQMAEASATVVPEFASIVGKIPYRIQLAGGWIDQPFVSRLNPDPVGSMVVVSVEPNIWLMDRCGMATGTRKVALRLWGDELPERP